MSCTAADYYMTDPTCLSAATGVRPISGDWGQAYTFYCMNIESIGLTPTSVYWQLVSGSLQYSTFFQLNGCRLRGSIVKRSHSAGLLVEP